MPKKLTGYRVFIASPSGLEAEREAFNKVIHSYNESDAIESGVLFIPMGWESTLPGMGRPQSLINEKIMVCDFFVLMLSNHWGSDPGHDKYSSGTEEEYHVALDCFEDGNAPMQNIIALFKAQAPESIADPDEQLAQVLDFRKKLERERNLYFQTFDDLERFEHMLRSCLAEWIRSHVSGTTGTNIPITSTLVVPLGGHEDTEVAITDEQLIEAEKLVESGRLAEAEEAYSKAIAAEYDPNALIRYGKFLMSSGRWSQAIQMFQRVVDKEGEGEPTYWVGRAYTNLGNIQDAYGNLKNSEAYHNKALKFYETIEYKEGIADACGNIGNIQFRRGELSQSEELFRKALKLYEEVDNNTGIAIACSNLGSMLVERDELGKAEELIIRACKSFEKIGKKVGIADAQMSLGNLKVKQDSLDQAIGFYCKALRLYETLGNKEGVADALTNLGTQRHAKGDTEKSDSYFQEALKLYEEIGSKEGISIMKLNLGVSNQFAGNLDKADELTREALEMYEQIGNKIGIVNAYHNLSAIYNQKGDAQKAQEFIQKSNEIKNAMHK